MAYIFVWKFRKFIGWFASESSVYTQFVRLRDDDDHILTSAALGSQYCNMVYMKSGKYMAFDGHRK